VNLDQKRLSRMRALMQGYVERGELPGLVTIVSRPGEVHVDVFGSQEIGGKPMRRDSIFRISSMTKPITATAALLLVDEGKLSLDAPLDEVLPELPRVTLRGLLTLTWGFGQMDPAPEEIAQ
jgi:CubicO group peptidase (beta-lactamase class C family)